MAAKNFRFRWSTRSDDLLIREMFVYEPWQCTKGTEERGNCWGMIADSLNRIEGFDVEKRSVRDRYNTLETNFKRKMNVLEKATGDAPPEESQFEIGMRDIIERFREKEEMDKATKQEKVVALEKGVEMRNRALETWKETRSRKAEDETPSTSTASKRTRRTGSELIAYLEKSSERNHSIKEKELELRKRELDLLAEQNKQQTTQNNQMMSAMMELLKKK